MEQLRIIQKCRIKNIKNNLVTVVYINIRVTFSLSFVWFSRIERRFQKPKDRYCPSAVYPRNKLADLDADFLAVSTVEAC